MWRGDPFAAPRKHQLVVSSVLSILHGARTSDLAVLPAPTDVVFSERTVFQPDVLLGRREDLTVRDVAGPPVLAVEVLSPSTRSVDRLLKFARYAEAGVEHYWIIDPDEPSLTAFRLHGAASYTLVAHVVGDDQFTPIEPLEVVIIPTALIEP